MSRDYTAIDPGRQLITCTCSRVECHIAPMLSAREHAASLLRAIYACSEADALKGDGSETWHSVVFPLEMACGVENVRADPTFAWDDDSWVMCDTAWDHDERRREAASKYIAALAVFNFVWAAYEAAISAATNVGREKVPVAGRNYLRSLDGSEKEILGFYSYLGMAKTCCRKVSELQQQIDRSLADHQLSGAGAAAELARIFRNYIFHGDDSLPDGDEGDVWSYYRFYSVSMLCMVLIQVLAISVLDKSIKSCELYDGRDFLEHEPRRLLLRAHLKGSLMPSSSVAEWLNTRGRIAARS